MNKDYVKWNKTSEDLPPLGLVVEVMGPKGWHYTNLGRDYFALITVNNEHLWIAPSMSEHTYKELKVKFWRFIPPDPKGKFPFIKVKLSKKHNYYEPKVIFLKDE